LDSNKLAQLIDHTNVRGDATEADIRRLCNEAKAYNFKNVCVTPTNAKLANDLLKDYETGICVVIGFPLGVQTLKTKAFETDEATSYGASEIDMVINVGSLKSERYPMVKDDIIGVLEAANGKIVKTIMETALLTSKEKVKACLLAKEAGADFVKTSTGFGGLAGATIEDVNLLRSTVGSHMGVKASGGIRDLETVLKMLDAGANRIGTSTGVQIMEENKKLL
jgi:deoxyribose-phosphate aldolase